MTFTEIRNVKQWIGTCLTKEKCYLIATIKQASILACILTAEREIQTDNSTRCSKLSLTLGLCKAVKEMEMRAQDLCEIFCNVWFFLCVGSGLMAGDSAASVPVCGF